MSTEYLDLLAKARGIKRDEIHTISASEREYAFVQAERARITQPPAGRVWISVNSDVYCDPCRDQIRIKKALNNLHLIAHMVHIGYPMWCDICGVSTMASR